MRNILNMKFGIYLQIAKNNLYFILQILLEDICLNKKQELIPYYCIQIYKPNIDRYIIYYFCFTYCLFLI